MVNVTQIRKENSVISKSMLYMFLGLLTSAVVSFATYATGLAYTLSTGYGWFILSIVQIVSVLIFSNNFSKMKSSTVALMFFGYSILNGLTLSSIFMIYRLDSIIYIFGLSAVMFLALSLLGKYTNVDMSKATPYLFTFLVGGLIFSLLNVFIFKSSLVSTLLNWGFLAIFCGITIYDVNQISKIDFAENKFYIYFAFSLYLDFINIFISILNLSARRK